MRIGRKTRPSRIKWLGRGDEALEAAWADFRKHPSKFTYDDLMQFVPKTERTAWHEKALMPRVEPTCTRCSNFFHRNEGNGTIGRPGARLWRAQGMRIVNAKKSKYYDAALSNFERARDCYQRAGLATEWEKTVRRACALHYRKTGFIGGFQALAAGAKRSKRPSFLERAKTR